MNLQINSPLFKIPAEIRSKIYRLVLARNVFHTDRSNEGHWDVTICPRDTPSISNVCSGLCREKSIKVAEIFGIVTSCRRIYIEALYIVYEENAFCFSTWILFDDFRRSFMEKKTLCKSSSPQIRHLQVRTVWITHHLSFGSLAALLDGVQKLDMDPTSLILFWEDEEMKINMAEEFLQLRGLTVKNELSMEARRRFRIRLAMTSLMAALKEVMEQPKTSQSPLLLTQAEKAEALKYIGGREFFIRAEMLGRREDEAIGTW